MKIINLGNLITNTYLIRNNSGYLLIDTGYNEQFEGFCRKLKLNNIGLNEIEYVFLTHAHDDHAGFLNELLYNSNAKVILHKEATSRLKTGQNSFEGGCTSRLAHAFCIIMKLLGKGEHKFLPVDREDRYITTEDIENTSLAKEIPGIIIDLPGHTGDSIGLLLDDGTLFCGDAAMNGFPSSNRITIWVENLNDYKKSWETIIRLNPKMIYPGHGKPFKVKDLMKRINKIDKVCLKSL